MMVQSVSCPTAEMSGMVLAATARATISSLKPHRSSRLPPPRATMIRSGRGTEAPTISPLKPWMAAATSTAQVSPCTLTGQTRTWIRKRQLACRIEQAFGRECALPLLEQSHEGADAGRLEIVDDDLIGRFVGIGGDPAFDYDLEPLLRLELEPLKGAPPDERVDDGVLVLELEVAVARAVLTVEVGDLAAELH